MLKDGRGYLSLQVNTLTEGDRWRELSTWLRSNYNLFSLGVLEEDTRESTILDLKINIVHFIYLVKEIEVARMLGESNHLMLNVNKKGKLKLNIIEHIGIRKLILIHSGTGLSA